ncbi:hypothetical protein CDAR_99151 [Caerostris darwini]|uniref:Uncharacterized protein n=1 Tax=Caerostris darwini TaxID=1538125 RepID=A0AAV4Q1Q3_9ARAC|nr:hypothetical protein CDAR_99151 [Caerostris darwini]
MLYKGSPSNHFLRVNLDQIDTAEGSNVLHPIRATGTSSLFDLLEHWKYLFEKVIFMGNPQNTFQRSTMCKESMFAQLLGFFFVVAIFFPSHNSSLWKFLKGRSIVSSAQREVSEGLTRDLGQTKLLNESTSRDFYLLFLGLKASKLVG